MRRYLIAIVLCAAAVAPWAPPAAAAGLTVQERLELSAKMQALREQQERDAERPPVRKPEAPKALNAPKAPITGGVRESFVDKRDKTDVSKRIKAQEPAALAPAKTRPKKSVVALPQPKSLDSPIARVDQEWLTYREVRDAFVRNCEQWQEEIKAVADDDWIAYKNRTMGLYVNDWIDKRLLLGAASEAGIRAGEPEVQKQLAQLRDISLLGEELETLIEKQGGTLKQLTQDLRDTLTIERYLTSLAEKNIPEAQLTKAYKANKKDFYQPRSAFVVVLYKCAYTVIKGEGDSKPKVVRRPNSEIEADKAQLDLARKRLKAVKDFVDLAREISDPPYSEKHCVIGWVQEREEGSGAIADFILGEDDSAQKKLARNTKISRDLNKFYFKQKEKQISPVFESEAGVLLAMVIAFQPERGRTFESAREIMLGRAIDNIRQAVLYDLRQTKHKAGEVAVDFRGLDAFPALPRNETAARPSAAAAPIHE